MDKKLEQAINKQINAEYYSSYLYLSMAAYCEASNLPGIAHWMQMQAKEEMIHVEKFFAFVNDRGGRVLLEAIAKPLTDFASIKDVFQKTLEHEQKVTQSINNLYALARDLNDNAATTFLQWFITEQVEEEKSVSDILGKLRFIKEESMGILMLDQELGARVLPAGNAAE